MPHQLAPPADGTHPSSKKEEKWRRGGDSNPRRTYALTGFRNRAIQPLWHLSARVTTPEGAATNEARIVQIDGRISTAKSGHLRSLRQDAGANEANSPTGDHDSGQRGEALATVPHRFLRKKERSSSALSSAWTPSNTTQRWFRRSSSSTLPSDRTAPNLGSRAPNTTRRTLV